MYYQEETSVMVGISVLIGIYNVSMKCVFAQSVQYNVHLMGKCIHNYICHIIYLPRYV